MDNLLFFIFYDYFMLVTYRAIEILQTKAILSCVLCVRPSVSVCQIPYVIFHIVERSTYIGT